MNFHHFFKIQSKKMSLITNSEDVGREAVGASYHHQGGLREACPERSSTKISISKKNQDFDEII